MTAEQRAKICKRMLWIIPGMILAIIGDYCMGIEPKDSTSISFMISSGWLTIADWRIAMSNIGGLDLHAVLRISGERHACCLFDRGRPWPLLYHICKR